MTDIERKRGDTYADEWEVLSETTGEPMDITGFSFLLTVDPAKAPTDDTNNVFQIVGVITDASGGLVEFAPTALQADNVGKYFYDIQMIDDTSPTPRKRTIDAGKYKLVQDITKD